MATHSINIALLGYAGPYYLYNTTSVEAGDTVTISVFWGTGETYVASCDLLAGSPYDHPNAVHIRSGTGAGGAANPAVFTFQVLGAAGSEQNFDFKGSIYNSSTGQYELTAYPDSARVKLLVTEPAVCNVAGPTGTLSASIGSDASSATYATL